MHVLIHPRDNMKSTKFPSLTLLFPYLVVSLMYQVIAIEEYVTEMIVLVTDPLGGLDPFYIQYVNAQDI